MSSSIWRSEILRPEIVGEAARVDAFAQAQAHDQQLVALFFPGQDVVGDHAVAARVDLLLPVERHLFGRGGVALVVDQQPAMGAGADAGIFAIAPVDAGCGGSPGRGAAWLEIS